MARSLDVQKDAEGLVNVVSQSLFVNCKLDDPLPTLVIVHGDVDDEGRVAVGDHVTAVAKELVKLRRVVEIVEVRLQLILLVSLLPTNLPMQPLLMEVHKLLVC